MCSHPTPEESLGTVRKNQKIPSWGKSGGIRSPNKKETEMATFRKAKKEIYSSRRGWSRGGSAPREKQIQLLYRPLAREKKSCCGKRNARGGPAVPYGKGTKGGPGGCPCVPCSQCGDT